MRIYLEANCVRHNSTTEIWSQKTRTLGWQEAWCKQQRETNSISELRHPVYQIGEARNRSKLKRYNLPLSFCITRSRFRMNFVERSSRLSKRHQTFMAELVEITWKKGRPMHLVWERCRGGEAKIRHPLGRKAVVIVTTPRPARESPNINHVWGSDRQQPSRLPLQPSKSIKKMR